MHTTPHEYARSVTIAAVPTCDLRGGVHDGKSVAEYFAGMGLMRMGLERAGWHTVFANDIDAKKLELYTGHYGDSGGLFVLGDVHALAPDQVPTTTLATASFPCTDLSLAGARGGLHSGGSAAFWGFARMLELMEARRPPLVLLENVVGFLTSKGGADLREAIQCLNALGYAVDALVVDAAHFVPQSRQRMFIVGANVQRRSADRVADRDLFGGSVVRPPALMDFIFRNGDLHWDIRDMPNPPTRRLNLADILEDLPASALEWWSDDRAAYLLDQMSERHRALASAMIGAPTVTYGTVFRRVRQGQCMAELRTDGVAGCLRTPRGGSGRQILFRAGHGQYRTRLLTPRECARLMGADDYVVNVPLNQALFGFGDAVCVPVVEWVATHCLEPRYRELIDVSTYAYRA